MADTATTSLTLSTGGIETTKAILNELKYAWDDRHPTDRIKRNAGEIGGLFCDRVEKLWRTQGRQVLSMHPGLAAEVALATSTKIEPEVFRTLPYRDPLVVFPGGIEVPSWKPNERARFLGFFTHGRSSASFTRPVSRTRADLETEFDATVGVTSTHDPAARRFSLVMINEVTFSDGGPTVFEFNRISFPLDTAQTLGEHIDRVTSNYGWDESGALGTHRKPGSTDKLRRAFMRAQLSLVLGSVMYLCSTVLDAEAVPKSRIKRAWGTTTRQVPNLINVGWRIGPALSAARAEARLKEASDLPGRSLPPHQRRAHFKTVWTGPGRTVPKTVFIAPYWVHKEYMHLVDTKTVRAVK
jgi:hypothetical protein